MLEENFTQYVEKFKTKEMSLSCVESFTGGLFSKKITDISGVSSFFQGGICTYSNQAKMKLGVKKEMLEKYTAVSSECAKDMASSGLKFFNSDCCISFTGNAGPLPSEGKRVGLFYIGIAILKNNSIATYSFEFYKPNLNRGEIRNLACELAFQELFKLI